MCKGLWHSFKSTIKKSHDKYLWTRQPLNNCIASVCSIFTNWTTVGILWHTNKWSVYIPRNIIPFLSLYDFDILFIEKRICIFMSSDKDMHRTESRPKFIFFSFSIEQLLIISEKIQQDWWSKHLKKKICKHYRFRSMDPVDPAIPFFCVLHSRLFKLMSEVAFLVVA